MLPDSDWQLDRLISMEENYIFTEDPDFLDQLHSLCAVDVDGAQSGGMGQRQGVFPSQMRQLLGAYFKTVQESAKNTVPKVFPPFCPVVA